MNTKYRFYSIVMAMALVVSPALQAETWQEWGSKKYVQAKTWVKENPGTTVTTILMTATAMIGGYKLFRRSKAGATAAATTTTAAADAATTATTTDVVATATADAATAATTAAIGNS